MPPLAIYFYDVVLAVHIAAVVIAFGVTFAYPLLVPYVARTNPAALGTLHRAQSEITKKINTPGMAVVLAAGIYMASDRDLFDKVWVSVPMVILFVLFGLSGAFFGPQERKLADLAERDFGGGGTTASPEYEAASQRMAGVGAAVVILILVAVFFMAAKPGGY
jgi:hypothetical protein